jgi:hypothetical protein
VLNVVLYVITTRRKGLSQGIYDIPVTVGLYKTEHTSKRLRVSKLNELQPEFTAQHTKYKQEVSIETIHFLFLSHRFRVLVPFTTQIIIYIFHFISMTKFLLKGTQVINYFKFIGCDRKYSQRRCVRNYRLTKKNSVAVCKYFNAVYIRAKFHTSSFNITSYRRQA